MKSIPFSTAMLVLIAGTAFGQGKQATTADDILAPVPGFTGKVTGEGERAGFPFPIDVANTPSWDAQFSANNVVRFYNIGAGMRVNGIGWDVVLRTVHPASWRSEIAVHIANSSGTGGFFLRPGAAHTSPGGPTAYSSGGLLKLANYNIPDVVPLADNLIRLEFFETYDDLVNAIDGEWVSGTVTLQIIPTPGAAGLLGLAGIGLLGRKRR